MGRLSWITQGALNAIMREIERGVIQRGEGNRKTEAEVGVMPPQVKECLGMLSSPEAGSGKEPTLPQSL